MAEIVCLIPVLGRTEQIAKVATSLRAASPEVRLVFICSGERHDDVDAALATDGDVFTTNWTPGPGDFAMKIDRGYKDTSEPWIFQGATDITFERGWDLAALECAAKTDAKVVGTWDGANPTVMHGRHSTHTLIARDYCDDPGASFDGPGTVFSTAYDHQWCDNELLTLAKYRGVWTFCREAKVYHHHPIFDRDTPRDATYEKGLAKGREDQQLFRRRHQEWTKGHRV